MAAKSAGYGLIRYTASQLRQAETYGTGGYADRRLHLVSLDDASATDLPTFPIEDRCAVLVAWDASDATTESVSEIAEALLARGAVYVCCWGEDCERVHDIVDEVWLGPDPPTSEHPDFVMTTWHAGDPLDEALWFLLFCATPDDSVDDACRDSVVLTIGNSSWAESARVALRDPTAFNARVV